MKSETSLGNATSRQMVPCWIKTILREVANKQTCFAVRIIKFQVDSKNFWEGWILNSSCFYLITMDFAKGCLRYCFVSSCQTLNLHLEIILFECFVFVRRQSCVSVCRAKECLFKITHSLFLKVFSPLSTYVCFWYKWPDDDELYLGFKSGILILH